MECLLCHRTFNNDFQKQHEAAFHDGRKVRVQTVGAPSNPFEIAAKRQNKMHSLSQIENSEEGKPIDNYFF